MTSRLIATTLLLLAVGIQPGFSQDAPAAAQGFLTVDPVTAGDAPKVTGQSLVKSGQITVSVNGHVARTSSVNADGVFSVDLGQAIKAGDHLEVAQLTENGQNLGAVAVDAQTPAVKKTVESPQGLESPPSNLKDYFLTAGNESGIQQIQRKIRSFLERDNSPRAARKLPPAATSQAAGTALSNPIGCVDDTFHTDVQTLRMDLNSRSSALNDLLKKALDDREKFQGNDVDRVNYDRMVRSIRAAIDLTQKQTARVPEGICPLRVTPFNLVTIYEETEKERIQQYNPVMADQRLTTFSIDKGSKIRIEINAAALSPEAVFGGVKISGNLTNGGKTAKVEVANYSQVSVDPKSQKSQQAVNLQAASDIKYAFADLWAVALKLVTVIYDGKAPTDWVNGDISGTWWDNSYVPDPANMSPTQIQDITSAYRQYKNELEGIIAIMTSNPALQVMVSSILGMPQSSVQTFLKDFKTNLETMLSSDYQSQPQAKARQAVVQTTLDIWAALLHTQDYIDGQKWIAPNQPDSDAENAVFDELYQQVIDQLRKQIQPGEIDLPSYQPQDGATLALQVEIVGNAASGADNASSQGSSSAVALFTAKIKDYRARPELIDSTFYLRRMRDVRAANGTLARVNFAPAPGATYALIFRSRGPSGLEDRCMDRTGVLWLRGGSACPDGFQPLVIAHQTKANRFFSALAPGIGANVNLLNFANPAPQLPTGGYGTPDTAPTVQIGTGFVGSLFGGAIQFTYGWDLNIEKSRSYWGIGFSFVKIGQAAVQKLGGGSPSSSSSGN